MNIVAVSFPVSLPCQDRYCPISQDYPAHSHTLYNNYSVPAHLYYDGMPEISAAEIATSIDLYATAPVVSKKGALQNV